MSDSIFRKLNFIATPFYQRGFFARKLSIFWLILQQLFCEATESADLTERTAQEVGG